VKIALNPVVGKTDTFSLAFAGAPIRNLNQVVALVVIAGG
jgi:hypothetical protein